MKSTVYFAIQSPMVFAATVRTGNTSMAAVPISAFFVVQQVSVHVAIARMGTIKSNCAARLLRSTHFFEMSVLAKIFFAQYLNP